MVTKGEARQYLAAACSSICIFCGGIAFVWTTPLLVRLEDPNSELPLTSTQSSWVVSLIELGNLISPFPCGFLADRFGRKPILLSTGPTYMLTWVLLLSTRSVEILYVARVIQGFGMGIQFTVLPMYLGEIAGSDIRGVVSIFFQAMWYLGVLYVYCIGPFVSYQAILWLGLAPCFVFMFLFIWMPESPYFLLMRGKKEKGAKALAWLRGAEDTTHIEKELEEMSVSIQEELKNKGGWRDIVTTKEGRKASFIIMIICITEMLSGVGVVLSYASYTFAQTEGDFLNPDIVTLIMGTLIFLVSLVTGGLIDRAGRRPILLISYLGGGVCLLAAAISYHITHLGLSLGPLSWLPYVSITLFITIISFGASALIPTLQAELFSNRTRGVASAVVCTTLTLASFIVLKSYQPVTDKFGLYVNYYIFSTFTFIGGVYIYFYVPETKGKTFAEIQKILQ